MSYADIGRLTLYQWAEVEGHHTDKEGSIVPEPDMSEVPESEEESFRAVLALQGLPGWLIERKWRARFAAE